MRRNAIVTLAVLTAVLALGAMVGIPAYVSSGIEDDLTRDGGRAHVKVSGFPPTSLLDDEGGSIDVSASGLRLGLPDSSDAAFDGLQGYDEVHVDLRDVRTGPYKISRVRVDRARSGSPYKVKLDATTTAQEGADPGDSFMGDLVTLAQGDLTPSWSAPVNLRLDARTGNSSPGDVEVVGTSGDASVRVKATPSLKPPTTDHDSIEISATGLDLAVPADEQAAVNGLDGYEAVHADLRDVRSGPFDVNSVRIDRASAGNPYLVTLDATADPQDLGEYTVDDWGDSFIGDLISRVEGDITTSSTEPVNLRLTARVETTAQGVANVEVVSGGAEGLDRNAIARALTSAVLARL